MPVESPKAAPPAAARPFRLLTKGPEYFRRQAGAGGAGAGAARKPSAVERLEADKAKYVKSRQVASTRQEPVRPPVLKQPLFSPGGRRAGLAPSRRAPPGGRRAEGCGPKASLNLDILNNLINLCDGPLAFSPKAEKGPAEPPWLAEPHGGLPATPRKKGPAPEGQGSAPSKPPSTVAVRRVDVRPCGALRSGGGPPAIRLTPVSSSPAHARVLPASPLRSPGPCGQGLRPESAKRQAPLHRSKSDLSDRLSRATADLERFFNYCGLDPEDVGGVEVEVGRFPRASSDIVSVQFHSVSTASSEGARSRRSAVPPEERPAERMPYGISIIERNARVIKWLYGLRQAREPPKVSNV